MNDTDRSRIHLSQSNLQDFLDCPRRFELKTLQEASWPAPLSDPPSRFEELTEIGDRFHKLGNQFFIGIDPASIETTLNDPDLTLLWQAFYPYARTLAEFDHYTEQILRTELNGFNLVAKYDYVGQTADGSYLIIDWKTGAKKPDRSTLASRVQTYLYPYIFYESFQDLFKSPHPYPENVVFQYWYPLSSEPEEIFPYSEVIHLKTRERLVEIIAQIDKLLTRETSFPLTEDTRRCQFCNFRSFCERGQSASPLSPNFDYESEDLSNAHFDLDLIEEIEF